MRFGLLMAILAGSAVFGMTNLRHAHLADPMELRRAVDGFGTWAPAIWVGLLALRPVVFLPAAPTMMAGGLAFGIWMGALWTTLGFTLAAFNTYLLARWLGYDYVRARLGSAFGRTIEAKLEPWLVFLLNLVPFVPLSIPNYGSPLTGLPLPAHVAASAAGLAPRVLAWSAMGSELASLDTLELACAATLMAFLAAVPFMMPSIREKVLGFVRTR